MDEQEEAEYTPPAPEPKLWEKVFDLRKGVPTEVAVWCVLGATVLGLIVGILCR